MLGSGQPPHVSIHLSSCFLVSGDELLVKLSMDLLYKCPSRNIYTKPDINTNIHIHTNVSVDKTNIPSNTITFFILLMLVCMFY